MQSTGRTLFLLALLPLLLLLASACDQPRPRSGMELAQLREMEAGKKERDVVVIDTDLGEIVLLVGAPVAKNTTRQFLNLIEQGFYNGLAFHYVEAGAMIQGGDLNSRDDDPTNDGAGDPGFTMELEAGAPNLKGSIGIAHPPDQPGQGNSQFYILLRDMPELNGRYTVFGTVVEGLEVVEQISQLPADERGHPRRRVEIRQVRTEKRVL